MDKDLRQGGRIFRHLILCTIMVLAAAPSAWAQDAPPATALDETPLQLSAAQVFTLADTARAARDFDTARRLYRALEADPDADIRNEARFRLGMMLADDEHRYTDAAVALRRILDETPSAARVRVEMARILASTGNMRGAERELRAAQAAGLPPEVDRMVRFYAQALSQRKPWGGSFEVALAPDSNINRATRADTLGTVIGDFTLNEGAKARSGLGLSARGQLYARLPLSARADMLARASAGGLFYRAGQFNDLSTGLQIGPQFSSGSDRLTLAAGPTWRWYGGDLYSRAWGGNASYQHNLGKRSQLRLEGGVSTVSNRANAMQSSHDYSASVSVDRALSARLGGGVQLAGYRSAARDPGYALTSGGINIYAFREVGRTTLVGTLGYNHLEADARLFLYPRRRIDDRMSASAAATLRTFTVAGFAPLVRLRWEHNRSSIEIYEYRRLAAEFGVTSAF